MGRMDFDLKRMLKLRRAGWSLSALGYEFGKDHTTILHHCRKHGVEPEMEVTQRGSVLKLPPKPKWKPKPRQKIEDKYADIFDRPVRMGRSYASYLSEALQRPTERQYMELYRLI